MGAEFFKMCVCVCVSAHFHRPDSGILADGMHRTTMAMSTNHWIIAGSARWYYCWRHLSKGRDSIVLEALHDMVFRIAQEFTVALDNLHDKNQRLLKTSHSRSFFTIQNITKAVHNLVHFHLNEKDQADHADSLSETVLPIHTDMGLFLMFVLDTNCDNDQETLSNFYAETNNGIEQRAIFELDSLWSRSCTLTFEQ